MSGSNTTPPACSAFDPTNPPTYGYTPSLAAGITFTILFATATSVHLAQTLLSRRWWQLVFVLGGTGELLGWIARTWASCCPYSDMAFEMQISTLIFSPAFFSAGIYIILGYYIRIFGPHTSPLSSKQYLWVFCTIDFFSLLLQAVGGGMASAASGNANGNVTPGTDTMIVGIVFQLASNVVFAGLFAYSLAKTYQPGGKGILNIDDQAPIAGTSTTKLRILAAATAVSTTALIVRGVYRSVELIQGWTGYLITTERYFIGLDGALMVIAVTVFVVANPHWLLPHKVDCPADAAEKGDEKGLEERNGSESE